MHSAILAVGRGVKAVCGAWRMPLVFWFWNVAFAVAVVAPLAALLARDLGHSLYAREMLASFDLQWLMEFVRKTRGWPAAMLGPLALVAAGGYLLVSTFLAGGAITIFAAPERRYVPAVFYQGCGRNFGRLFRLLLWSGVCYAVVFGINGGLSRLGQRLWRDSMEQKPVLLYGWLCAALVLLLFLFVNMVFDYAKIRLVAEDSRKSLRAALGSFRLVGRHLGRTSLTYALVTLAAVLLLVVYAPLCGAIPRGRGYWLLLVLLLQQAYVFLRLGVRLLFFASQTEVYLSLRRPAEEPAEPAPPQPERAEGAAGEPPDAATAALIPPAEG